MIRSPKYLYSAIFVVFLTLGFGASSCAKAQPQLSPAGQAAVSAKQVIQALDVARDFAIAANAQTPPMISAADTLKIVDWHEQAVKVIVAVPGGWKATLQASLTQLQKDVPADVWSRLLPYVTLVETLMAGVV